jgi:hypothetical protein
VERINRFFHEFLDDPLGKAIEAAVYLVMLAVGVAIILYVGKWGVGFVQHAAS